MIDLSTSAEIIEFVSPSRARMLAVLLAMMVSVALAFLPFAGRLPVITDLWASLARLLRSVVSSPSLVMMLLLVLAGALGALMHLLLGPAENLISALLLVLAMGLTRTLIWVRASRAFISSLPDQNIQRAQELDLRLLRALVRDVAILLTDRMLLVSLAFVCLGWPGVMLVLALIGGLDHFGQQAIGRGAHPNTDLLELGYIVISWPVRLISLLMLPFLYLLLGRGEKSAKAGRPLGARGAFCRKLCQILGLSVESRAMLAGSGGKPPDGFVAMSPGAFLPAFFIRSDALPEDRLNAPLWLGAETGRARPTGRDLARLGYVLYALILIQLAFWTALYGWL